MRPAGEAPPFLTKLSTPPPPLNQMTVPEGRIFLINSMGELHNINHTYRQTYLSLSRHVDLTFPPLPHDGADDSFDGHEVEDYADNDDDDGDGDAEIDDAVDCGGGGGGEDVGGSLTRLPKSVSSSSSVAGGGGAGGAGDGADGPNGGSGGGGVSPATGACVADTDIREINGVVPTVGGERGDGSKSRSQASRRPSLADSSSSGGGGGGKEATSAKAKGAPSIPRRWAEVAPRREKSFYPNRAAVEDRFTDLNFWRDPPPLIGDDDDDDDDDDDGEDDEESQREEDDSERAVAVGNGEEDGVVGGNESER